MAKLSAHGKELDRREYPTCRVAVMSDGNIMRDSGQGWKLWKKVKAGESVADYARDVRAKYDARSPLFHEYVKALKASVCLEHRWMLHEAVKLMPTDPDGVWSTMEDRYAGVDLDDCVTLCRLRQSAELADMAVSA